MKMIISPALNMKPAACLTPPKTMPVLLKDCGKIAACLADCTPWDLAAIMSLNDKLAADSFDRNQHIRLDQKGYSALELYNGLVFNYMNPQSFSPAEKAFAQEHLYILSGLYGILRPYDSIYEYRLEMKNRLCINSQKSLYKFWGNKLYEELQKQKGPIINLASDEYSKCIKKYLMPEDVFITCTFKVWHKGKYKVQATAAKMARGRMAAYIIHNQITDWQALKHFAADGYYYEESLSSATEFVFLRDSF